MIGAASSSTARMMSDRFIGFPFYFFG